MDPLRVTFAADTALDGNTLTGTAHVFGTRATVMGHLVEFAPGAFDEALRTSDARAFLNHSGIEAGETPLLLGRQSSGTLRLSADADGLHYAIDLPDTSYARDARVLYERGDLREMSFAVIPGTVERTKSSDGRTVLRHTSVRALLDVSPVAFPAFAGTSIALHGQAPGPGVREQAIRARAHVMENRT